VACGARDLLLTSSGAVYGQQPPKVTHVSEDWQGAPDTMNTRSAYAEGKRMAELLCSIYHHRYDVRTKIARCFAFIGPYLPLDAHFAIGNFISDCLNGRPIEIRGDGTAYRSYLYAADLAIWLWTVLVRGRSCHPYNVGSEEAISIGELAFTVRETLDANQPVRIAGTRRQGVAAERYVPDTARARNELALEQWVALEHAILRTAGWYRSAVQIRSTEAVFAGSEAHA
jgi:nucleoside-diphosphate-sugar epimerase